MRRIRVFVLVFTAFALLSSLLATTDAGANQAAALSAGTATVETGNSTTIPVTFDPGSLGVAALTIEITYDATVIRVDSCTSNVPHVWDCGFGNPGVVRLLVIDLKGITAGTLGEIGVTGSSAGASALDVSIETIVDANLDSLAGNTFITDGNVTVEEPEPEPEPEPRKRWRRFIRRLWKRWLRAFYFGHWNGW